MADITKFIAIALLSFFYGYTLFLIFHPNVSDEYRSFYIEKTVDEYPGLPRKTQYFFIHTPKIIVKNPQALKQ